MSAQTQKPASAPDAVSRSEAETRWRSAPRGASPSSTWERRPLGCCSVPPLSCWIHVKGSAAPQGGGRTHLWGDDCLLLLLLLLSCVSCSLLHDPKTDPQSDHWLYMMAEYSLRLEYVGRSEVCLLNTHRNIKSRITSVDLARADYWPVWE